MRLVLDQGLPRSAVERSSERGIEAVHTADVGVASERDEDRVVVTLDADFHALLVRSGERAPSVIRLRIDRATAELVTDLIVLVLDRCRDDLESGAMVSTNGARARAAAPRNAPRDRSPAAAQLAREGVHEYELAAALDYAFRRRGAAGPAYETIGGVGRIGVSGCISQPVR